MKLAGFVPLVSAPKPWHKGNFASIAKNNSEKIWIGHDFCEPTARREITGQASSAEFRFLYPPQIQALTSHTLQSINHLPHYSRGCTADSCPVLSCN
jgi:hypothetical protein